MKRTLTVTATVAALTTGTISIVAAHADAPADATTTPAASPRDRADDRHLRESDHLTVDAATRAAQAALAAAEEADQRVTVAVVDRDGNTIVTLRGDGAGPQSYQSAERKAYTAVSWNAPTSDLVERLEDTPTLRDIPGTLFLPGGVPVAADSGPVAGIGVAGAPSGDLDEEYARAGAAALGLH